MLRFLYVVQDLPKNYRGNSPEHFFTTGLYSEQVDRSYIEYPMVMLRSISYFLFYGVSNRFDFFFHIVEQSPPIHVMSAGKELRAILTC